jgi:hypothetical protein
MPKIPNRSSLAGKITYERYRHLVGNDSTPFVRASDSPRVIDSATNWTAGAYFISIVYVALSYPGLGFAAASQKNLLSPISVIFPEVVSRFGLLVYASVIVPFVGRDKLHS